jgi:hypothetical protein
MFSYPILALEEAVLRWKWGLPIKIFIKKNPVPRVLTNKYATDWPSMSVF